VGRESLGFDQGLKDSEFDRLKITSGVPLAAGTLTCPESAQREFLEMAHVPLSHPRLARWASWTQNTPETFRNEQNPSGSSPPPAANHRQ